MILGFKADLNKYEQTKIVKDDQLSNEFGKIKEDDLLNRISAFI
jgi:hypothetical protein